MGFLRRIHWFDAALAAVMCLLAVGYALLIAVLYEPRPSPAAGGLDVDIDLTPVVYFLAGLPVLYLAWGLALRARRARMAWLSPVAVTVTSIWVWFTVGQLIRSGPVILVFEFGVVGALWSAIDAAVADRRGRGSPRRQQGQPGIGPSRTHIGSPRSGRAMSKTTETSTPYDSADYLTGVVDVAAYLEASDEEAGDDPAVIAQALGTIARSGNISELARRVGMSREGLYKALAANGDPTRANPSRMTRVDALPW